jgi:hypothetical protein
MNASRRAWLVLWLVVAIRSTLAEPAAAETQSSCSECFLGVYDDVAMTRSSGSISFFEVKDVYLGIRLPPGVRISKLEFDATYPGGFTVVDYTSFVTGAHVTQTASGVRVDWLQCVSGTRALFRVRVFGLGSVRNAVVQLRNAIATSCTATDTIRLPSGCYVLNPVGSRPPCAVGVEQTCWSAMKELFR